MGVEETIAEMKERVRAYPTKPDHITITTLCSHSSLQLFNAARNAGFRTLGIIRTKDDQLIYDMMPKGAPDTFLKLDNYLQLLENDEGLFNPIFIPHGSGVEYLRTTEGLHGLERLAIPTYGNRRVIPWEASREKQREWIESEAGLLMPKEVTSPDNITGPTIVKLAGAPGGKGSTVVSSPADYYAWIANQDFDYTGSTMQEFIEGKTYYLQFFATPFALFNEIGVEFFGIDRRDENGFHVVGNQPLVMRESLLARQGVQSGYQLWQAAQYLMPEGVIGPFCVETIIDKEQTQLYVFEVSARIVAGSNVFANGSPYSQYTYPDPTFNYADRMMHELAHAAQTKTLDKVIT